jgi:hypothetical protein
MGMVIVNTKNKHIGKVITESKKDVINQNKVAFVSVFLNKSMLPLPG